MSPPFQVCHNHRDHLMLATVNATVPVPTPEDLLKDDQLVAEIDAMDSVALGTFNKDGDKTGDYLWPDIYQ